MTCKCARQTHDDGNVKVSLVHQICEEISSEKKHISLTWCWKNSKVFLFFCFASGRFYKLGKLNFFLANRQSSVKVLLLRLFTTNASNSFDYFPPSLEVCKLKFFICTRIFKKRRTIKMPSWTFQLSFLASPDSQLCSSTMCEKANCIFLLE